MPDADVILAGGGLANSLLAYRLASARPELRLVVLEAGAALGGNHTWSFYHADLSAAQLDWLRPFIVREWPHTDVRFEGLTRRIGSPYASVTSERLHEVVSGALGARVRLATSVDEVTATDVRLSTKDTLTAEAVIDGRGFRPSQHLALRYQKFLGLEVELAAPHDLSGPIIMDARVPQLDGYRFVYVLPFSPTHLLVEDTYYADHQELDPAACRERITTYAAGRGWRIARVLREENGVLPITLGGDIRAFWSEDGDQPRSGLRALLFHATTGYSLPQAVAFADFVASLHDLCARSLAAAIRAHAFAHWRGQAFFRALNRMLFLAGRPEDRHIVLRRFYGFPDGLVSRFYAGALTPLDKARIVIGKPPVPLLAAFQALMASGAGEER